MIPDMANRKGIQLANHQWQLYVSAMERGHTKYQAAAKKNEDFWFGGGGQWEDSIKQALQAKGRPWLEGNIIFSTINTVLGYQTQSRMDIAFKPRESDDQEISDLLTKVAMYVVDQNRFPWLESTVFADGLIQQRGFYDIRMGFDDNLYGNIEIESIDPLDVIMDPDAKSYDPKDWGYVMQTKWMTISDLKVKYGPAKWRKVINSYSYDEPDFGDDGHGSPRNKFGDSSIYDAYYREDSGIEHVRVIERQWYKLTKRDYWYDLDTGDFYPVPDTMKESDKSAYAKQNGYEIISREVKRIRWTVTTNEVVLHDDWSPYEFYTIVPYFPYFRRGRTTGMVDNLIKMQEMTNKTFSQILHVVNSTANSGWTLEENVLSNMDVEDLEERGAETGLVIEHKRGSAAPKKIEPNQIPTGLDNLVNKGVDLIRLISGVSETFSGGKGPEVSGTAIQSRVHQSAIQLAGPIDNLFRTRHMVAERMLWMIQAFYTSGRTFLITNNTEDGEKKESVQINYQDAESGEIVNDLTKGKYDVVIADVPTQITFQNAQFSQAIEMRKYGVKIPDTEMVKMSTLSRKNAIAEQMSGDSQAQAAQEQMKMQMEELEAKIKEIESKAEKNRADTATKIVENPSIAAIMDSLGREEEQPQELNEEQLPEQGMPLQSPLGA